MYKPKVTMSRCPNFIKIDRTYDLTFNNWLDSYIKSNLTHYQYIKDPNGRGSEKKPMYTFAALDKYDNAWRLPANYETIILDAIQRNGWELNPIIDLPMLDGRSVDTPLHNDIGVYDYQSDATDFILTDKGRGPGLISLQTGKGKTRTAANIASKVNKILLIMIKPGYIGKWISDIKELLNIDKHDILVVGGDHMSMQNFMLKLKKGSLKRKVYIVSNVSYQIYLNYYLDAPDKCLEEYHGVTPEMFFELTNAGYLLVDEVHQFFHLNVMILMFCKINLYVALSATLIDNQAFMEKIYLLLFPISNRYDKLPLDQYANAVAIRYQHNGLKGIRTKNFGFSAYSQQAYEQSIYKNPHRLKNYLEMINYYFTVAYVETKRPDDTIIIFSKRVEMCTLVRDYLRRLYPKLKIERYIADDPYENMKDGEAVTTTIGSGGTAIDKKNLVTVLCLDNVSSPKANIQAFGRLRKIDNVELYFLYFYAIDIDAHVRYDKERELLFRARGKTFSRYDYPRMI